MLRLHKPLISSASNRKRYENYVGCDVLMALPTWLSLGYTGFLAFVAIAAVIIGGSWLVQKFLKIRVPIISNIVSGKIASILGLVLIVLIVAPMIGLKDDLQSVAGTSGASDSGSTGDGAVDLGSDTCVRNPNAATQNILLATENIDNPADAYIGSTYNLVASDAKTIYNTGGSNVGTTLSYVTITVPHCVIGDIYVLGNSSSKVPFNANQPQLQQVISGAVTSRVNITPLNYDTGANIMANGSAPTTTATICPSVANCGGDGEDGSLTNALATNFTIGSGGSQNIKFQFTLPTANSRFGAFSEAKGVIVGAYISDLTAMSASNGVRINSIDNGASYAKVSCPIDIAANRRSNVCWDVSTLKSGGTFTVTGTLNCDLGDCAPTDFVDIYIDDKQWFKDTDGTFKLGSFDLSGTDVGTAGSTLRYFIN